LREVVVTTTLRCDLCGSTGTDVEPIQGDVPFSWKGQDRVLDLCVLDNKEVSSMFEALMEKSRRPENQRGRGRKLDGPKRRPYSGDTRFNQWYNETTGMFECPYVEHDGEHERKCNREFTAPNGLAVHHNRQHGSNL
jgi:hypothetical protein